MLAIASCSQKTSTTESAGTGNVQFVLDAPLCSSSLPMEFRIDGHLAGTDTFRVNYAPNHTQSVLFSVPAGIHTTGARAKISATAYYTWPDTTVNVQDGATFTDSLPFYCS